MTYYNRSIVPIREENVPLITKKLRVNTAALKFQKQASVFRDWIEDEPIALQRAWNHDKHYWKVHKITDDPIEQDKTSEVIRKHFAELKEVFWQCACHYGNPPDIGKREFGLFCQTAKIYDNNITSGIVDTYFKAANFEEIDQDQNDDNSLCRFEFLEMCVRIAKGKYIDFGNYTSLSEATEKFIKTYIIPMEVNLFPYTRFRTEHLYTNEVNDLLQVNLAGILRIYDSIAAIKGVKHNRNFVEVFSTKVPTIDQVLNAFAGRIPDIDDKMILRAFYFSKMTVAEETTRSE